MKIGDAWEAWGRGELSDGEWMRELTLALAEVNQVILKRESDKGEKVMAKLLEEHGHG